MVKESRSARLDTPEEGLEEIAVTRPVTGGRAAEKNKTIGSLGPRLGAEIGIGSKMVALQHRAYL